MADKKKKGNDMVQQYTEMLEQGIRDVFENGKFDEYLQTMSRFHNYSARNITLIHQQLPGATHVAGFNKWRDEFDRHVVRGQSAIKIWAPTPYKVKEEQVKTDPNTGRPVMGTDGKPITEEVETTRPSFRLVNVFDVSQTDGKPLPQLAENIDGDVQYYDLFRQALEQSTDRPITYEPMRDGLDGFVRISDGSIHIATGMSQAQTVAALLHEMTHATLGHDKEPEEPETAGEKEARNNREEVEAESVAYVVAQYFGIDTGANSFGYVAAWSKDKGLDELKASLDTIKKTASQMISVIDENFAELKKEHGIEQTTIEAEAVRVIPSHESAIAFATDFHTYMQTHNEAAGLPRFGMDEPHLVIAQITQEIIDGSGIEDIRNTILQRLDEGIEAATVEKLLRRLHGFEKVEYIMPEPEEGSRISTPGIEPEVPDETETALHQHDTDTPKLNPVEQFGVDYFTFMNERRAEEGTRPYTEDRTPAENLEGFEAVFREGGNGQIRYVLESWMEEGKQPAAEQAKALLDKLDTLETELWPNYLELPEGRQKDIVQDYAAMYAEVMQEYYQQHPLKSVLDSMDNEPKVIAQQIGTGYTSYLTNTLLLAAQDQNFAEQANRLLSGLNHITAIRSAAVIDDPALEFNYDLGFGHLGNGLTVWNRLEEQDGDYRTLAHISPDRKVRFYDHELPVSIAEKIEDIARTTEMNISASQDSSIFTVPPLPLESPARLAKDFHELLVDAYTFSYLAEIGDDVPGVIADYQHTLEQGENTLQYNLREFKNSFEQEVQNGATDPEYHSLISRAERLIERIEAYMALDIDHSFDSKTTDEKILHVVRQFDRVIGEMQERNVDLPHYYNPETDFVHRISEQEAQRIQADIKDGRVGRYSRVIRTLMEEEALTDYQTSRCERLLEEFENVGSMIKEQTADMPDTSERLAYDLNEFMQEFDPYEYRDAVPSEEEQILHDTEVISNGGNEFEGIKKFLMEITADEAASDDVAKAKSLLERLNAYQSSHHQQAVSETIPEREQPDRTRSVPKLELSEQVADTTITPEQFDAITDDSLLPLNQNRALELFAQEQSIYRMDHMGNAFMIVNESEIMQHGGLFAIDADDWKELFAIALPPDKELAGEQDQDIPLLPGEGDRYAIYQIENTRDVEYAWRSLPNMEALQYEHYKQAYTAPLEPGITLGHLWERHNADDRPAGQTMRSMSMSDVVVMVRNGKEQAFYVGDSFTEVPQFLEQGKAAEVQRQTEPEQPEVFRYYSTQRPVDIGTYPTGKGILLVNFENYDTRQWVENDSFQAWGYLEYRQPLTSKQISDYELRAALPAESHIRAAEMSTEDNYNQIDGIPNNTTPKFDPDLPEPGNAKYGMEAEFLRSELEQAEFGMSKEDYVKSNFGEDEAPSLAELEADAAAGRQVSLLDLANAMKADKSNNPDKDKKKSLLGQLGAYKKQTNRSHEDKKPQQDRKNDEREV